MTTRRRIGLATMSRAAGFAAIMLGSAASADVWSTFDTDMDGWVGDAPSFQHTWGAAGGNPGGYIDFLDQSSGTGILNAPAAFLGDWSALDGVGWLQWDSIVFAESFAPSTIPFEVEISGPGGTATFTTGVNDSVWYSWVTTTAPLDQGQWSVSSGTWSGLLANVTSLRVLDERVANNGTSSPDNPGDHDGFDNFGKIVPAPGTTAGLGLAGLAAVRRRRR